MGSFRAAFSLPSLRRKTPPGRTPAPGGAAVSGPAVPGSAAAFFAALFAAALAAPPPAGAAGAEGQAGRAKASAFVPALHALAEADHRRAAGFIARALAADPASIPLLQSSLRISMRLGQQPEATQAARRLLAATEAARAEDGAAGAERARVFLPFGGGTGLCAQDSGGGSPGAGRSEGVPDGA